MCPNPYFTIQTSFWCSHKFCTKAWIKLNYFDAELNTDEHVISTFNFVQHGHRQEEERRRKEEQTGVVLSFNATM